MRHTSTILLTALVLLAVGPRATAAAQAAEPEAPTEGATTEDDEDAAEHAAMMTDGSDIDDQAAREFFNAGSNLYDLGRYEEAAEQFQQAFDLSDRVPLLFNVYLAHRDAANERGAAIALRLYLERMEEVENRPALESRLTRLEASIAEEDAQREDAARVAAEAVLAEQERERQEAARQAALRDAELTAAPWIIAGSGGAIMLGGVITGILALGLSSSLKDGCDEDPTDGTFYCPDDQSLRDQQSTLSVLAPVTDVLLIGGAVIAVGGLTWGLIQLLTAGDDGAEDEAPEVSAGCGPTGCGASVRMRF